MQPVFKAKLFQNSLTFRNVFGYRYTDTQGNHTKIDDNVHGSKLPQRVRPRTACCPAKGPRNFAGDAKLKTVLDAPTLEHR